MPLYPLTRPNRVRLARAFATVPRIDISIECAIEDQMGAAFVDSITNPSVFLIVQDDFFAYLAGELTTDSAHRFLREIPGNRFLMAGTAGWENAIQECFGERIRPASRYSFSSMHLRLEHLQELVAASPHQASIHRVDAVRARTETPYLSIGAFESADDFVERGIGFCMLNDDKIVGGAYSSLASGSAIEVSIVVAPELQRQGVATVLAAHLLEWCLMHDVEPHWDAANLPSCHLAEKLGYHKTGEYTAYYLK